jgi:hypothetical protein
MWRALVPLFKFAMDCWIGLGVFALMMFLLCALWGGSTLRRLRKCSHRPIEKMEKGASCITSSKSGAGA